MGHFNFWFRWFFIGWVVGWCMDEVEGACWGGSVRDEVRVDWCDEETFGKIRAEFGDE